ncbi:hypothetical protein I4F81_000771 [Pyropia yezoensis]|uniref:Uncharacterized protein n=1 Tax=Pyropia yezoensis TaxID=2788 RepID=A0ACC3BJM1_PYRYE|nr:hypothetical protein I4F81_000771 [Neopyropia yezoensis]
MLKAAAVKGGPLPEASLSSSTTPPRLSESLLSLFLSQPSLAAGIAQDLVESDELRVPKVDFKVRFTVRDLIESGPSIGTHHARSWARLLLYYHGLLGSVRESVKDGVDIVHLAVPNEMTRRANVNYLLLWCGLTGVNAVTQLMHEPSAERLRVLLQALYYSPARGAWVSAAHQSESTFQASMGAYITGIIDGLGLGHVDVKTEHNLSGKRSDVIIYDTSGGLVIIIELKLIRQSQIEWDLSSLDTHGYVRSFLAGNDSPSCSDADVFALRYKEAQFRQTQTKPPAGGSGHPESPLTANPAKLSKPRGRPPKAPAVKMELPGPSWAEANQTGGTRRGRPSKTPAHQGIKKIQSKLNEASSQVRVYKALVRDQLFKNKLVESSAHRQAGREGAGEKHPQIFCFVALAVYDRVFVQAVS